jgi:hypothetical protein
MQLAYPAVWESSLHVTKDVCFPVWEKGKFCHISETFSKWDLFYSNWDKDTFVTFERYANFPNSQ